MPDSPLVNLPHEWLTSMPLERLALKLQGHPDGAWMVQQVEGWRTLSQKVPLWAQTEGIEYPPRLSLEQCSSQQAAQYKARVVERIASTERHALADLTGGLGIDFSFMAPLFETAHYVERNERLCQLARHNFGCLALRNAQVWHNEARTFLEQTASNFDLIFLDPARRNSAGQKTVRIEDCEPNVNELWPLLQSRTRHVILKLSPMLDVSQALAALPAVIEVHALALRGECKELLLVADTQCNVPSPADIAFHAVGDNHDFAFSLAEERDATALYADNVDRFLFEPHAAVMKLAPFNLLSKRFGLKKLHPNSHLYTAPTDCPDFPGRRFIVENSHGFSKAQLRQWQGRQANLAVRNFPETVATLRKKLKLREGGNHYAFATTLANGQHVIIDTLKADN